MVWFFRGLNLEQLSKLELSVCSGQTVPPAPPCRRVVQEATTAGVSRSGTPLSQDHSPLCASQVNSSLPLYASSWGMCMRHLSTGSGSWISCVAPKKPWWGTTPSTSTLSPSSTTSSARSRPTSLWTSSPRTTSSPAPYRWAIFWLTPMWVRTKVRKCESPFGRVLFCCCFLALSSTQL